MRDEKYLEGLIKELMKYPAETGWIEFKHNNKTPDKIGAYISSLANMATLNNRDYGYLVWGIDDSSHEMIGTDIDVKSLKKGNEDIYAWLGRLLEPRPNFEIYTIEIESKKVIILEVEKATHAPVAFKNIEYVRDGSYQKSIKDFPEMERALWKLFDQLPFEDKIAISGLESSQVVQYLDYPSYFELMEVPLPEGRDGIIQNLLMEDMIVLDDAGKYSITNLGAILFAKDISMFKFLKRKAVRVIQYKGKSRIETVREQVGGYGYAAGFTGLIEYVDNLIPRNEVIGKALREEHSMYPDIAIRELVANAIIHQNFEVTGTGVMIEIFEDRMEITNPGVPIVEKDRFIDTPPKSRNEILASFMRRINICEERGSGFDKIVNATEQYQLKAPIIEVTDDHTKVVLFAHVDYKEMSKEDRVHATYMHACLKYVMREKLTNSSLRGRFGLKDNERDKASRVIKDAVEAGVIKLYNEETAPRYYEYIPYWA